MPIIVLAFTTFFIGAVSYYLWIWTYWRIRGLNGPMGYPLVGSIFRTVDPKHPQFILLTEWTKVEKYGRVFGFTEGVHRIMVISDPELINEVFIKQFDNFHGRKLNTIQGNPDKDKRVHLFAAQGNRWKRLKAISSPAFSNNSLRKIKDTVEDCALELIQHLEKHTSNGKSVDFLLFYQEFSSDVIGRIAMGHHESKMFNNPLMKLVKPILGTSREYVFYMGAILPFAATIFRKLMFSLKMNRPIVLLHESVTNAVNERVKQREADRQNGIEHQEPSDFIDLFLDAKSDEDFELEHNTGFTNTAAKVSRQLTIDEVVSQCLVFLVAGFETTALSLSYASFLLATHPKIMKKLQDEIDKECPDPSISFAQLAKLKYMDCIIKETLRLFPFGSSVNTRRCMKSTKIGNYEVEEGTDIIVDTWTVHYDKNIWGEDAEEFKPERWNKKDETAQIICYLAFGLGPRQCIGMRLAYMEEKLMLAHVLRKFSFATGERTNKPIKFNGSMAAPPKNVYLHLKSRD